MSDSNERPNALVPPRPAATIVLLRDAVDGIELFLVERHRSIGFMGGMHVFPGGKVAASDEPRALGARVIDPAVADTHVWGDDVNRDAAFARAVAAIRETYEEAGVLLSATSLPQASQQARASLLAGESFAHVLDKLSVQLRIGVLQPFSRWITPENEPVRFDTSFYLTRVPADQVADHDRGEAVDALWISPRAALESHASGGIRLAPPTQRTIEQLVDFASVDAALRFATSRPPPRIMPIIRSDSDNVMIFYPGDPEHPVRERAFPGATRHVLRKLPPAQQ